MSHFTFFDSINFITKQSGSLAYNEKVFVSVGDLTTELNLKK
jgi:hypothetical protein